MSSIPFDVGACVYHFLSGHIILFMASCILSIPEFTTPIEVNNIDFCYCCTHELVKYTASYLGYKPGDCATK